jgi:hypothetical protein
MDRNPMLQNLNNPMPNLGVIPGKARLDYYLIQECQANSEDGTVSAQCYPGGGNEINHDAMPGDSSFGLKCVRSIDVMEGEPNELGIVSCAGIHRGAYTSHRSMEDNFYWQGFVATESRLTNALNSNTSDPDHGYATIRAGTVSVINNGPYIFYPGSYVQTRWPKLESFGGSNSDVMKTLPDGTIVNATARGGTPSSQFRPELVPFDPYDVEVQIAAVYASLTTPHDKGAIPGLSGSRLEDALKFDCIPEAKHLSADQETAAGYFYGRIGCVLAGLETLVNANLISISPNANAPSELEAANAVAKLAIDNNLLLPDTPISRKMLANMFFTDLPDTNADAKASRTAFQAYVTDKVDGRPTLRDLSIKANHKNEPKLEYAKLRVLLSRFDTASICGAWFSKSSKVIGRSLNCAAPADTLHVLCGHFTL